MVALSESSHSSPCSTESSFRQIDDVFLQTQTRIWLGEVLQTRLSDQISIADILADGELLFAVSKQLWKMMLGRPMALRSSKAHEYKPYASKSSGRYMPYINVDSFLKTCKIMGLAGIDLFSPSDVVEKRDTRKVCMCIRALSKKARTRHLNVPDFDIVTYTAAMSTNMVGYIRRSWELSPSDHSASSTHTPKHEPRQRYRQKDINAIAGRDEDLNCQDSDGPELHISLQSDSPAATPCSCSPTSQISSDLISYPRVSSVENMVGRQGPDQSDVQKKIEDDFIQSQEVNKFTRYHFSHHLAGNPKQDYLPSASSLDSNPSSGNLDFSGNHGARISHIYFGPSLEDEASVVGDYDDYRTPETNITDAHRRTSSAIISHETCSGDSVLLDGKYYVADTCEGDDCCCSEETGNLESKFRSQYRDANDVEASVNSISVASRHLDFDDHLLVEDASDSDNSESIVPEKKALTVFKSRGLVKCEVQSRSINNQEESVLDIKNIGIDYYSPEYASKDTAKCAIDEQKELFSVQSCFAIGLHQWDQKGKFQVPVLQSESGDCLSPSPINLNKENLQSIQRMESLWPENMENAVIVDDTKAYSTTLVKSEIGTDTQTNQPCNVDTNRWFEESNVLPDVKSKRKNVNEDEGKDGKLQVPGVDNPSIFGIEESKPRKGRVLKAVVKGSAIVGVLFLLLHFRKYGREQSSESIKQSNQERKTNAREFLLTDERRSSRAEAIYPAEKLKFGH